MRLLTYLCFVLITVSGQCWGQQTSRQLLQNIEGQAVAIKITPREQLKNWLQGYLAQDALFNATELVVQKIEGNQAYLAVNVMVDIVQEEDRGQTQQISDILTQLNSRYPNYYQQILSLGLNSEDTINEFDRLLCLQTNRNSDLCFGDDSSLQQVKQKQKQVEDSLGEQQEGADSFEGSKLLEQLKNGDYNSAAWTIISNLNVFQPQEFAKVINQAADEGASNTVGEAIITAMRLAARQGIEENMSNLLKILLVQQYNSEVISALGKSVAIASQEGQSLIIQQIVLGSIESGGQIRSIAEIMHQISVQGGEDGSEAMAMAIGDAKDQHNILTQIMVHAMCRGEAYSYSFGQIYEDIINLFTCDKIDTQFLSSIAFAAEFCKDHSPINLYAFSPNLQACNLTQNYVPNFPLNLQQFNFLNDEIRSYVQQFQPKIAFNMFFQLENIDFDEIINIFTEPLPEVNSANQFNIQAFVPDNFDEYVENAHHVKDMPEIQYQIVEILKSLQQKLFNDARYQNLFYVEESASLYDDLNSQQFKCMDISPEDNLTVTCEERKSWGGCEKDWMMESFYCARTCGYCTFDAPPQNNNYDNNLQIKEYKFEEQTQIPAPAITPVSTPDKAPRKKQDKNQSSTQKNIININNFDDTCMDIVPEDNVTATCQERQDWGGCDKEWMQNGNYCAKTCGFCDQQIIKNNQEVDQHEVVSQDGTYSLLQQLSAAFSRTDAEGTAEEKKSKGIKI